MNHLISTKHISKEFLFEVFEYANLEDKVFALHQDKLKGKILTTLFWQNSLRTQLSFKSSFMKLGGNCLDYTFQNTNDESLEDSIKYLSNYCDIIVARSNDIEDITILQEYSSVPVISAGHSTIEHPTTAIGEAYMINRYFNRLDNLNILFFGYLPSRAFQSLYLLLKNNFQNNFHIITPSNCTDTIYENKSTICINSFNSYIKHYNAKDIDIIYISEYKNNYKNIASKDTLYFDKSMLKHFKDNVYITHCLPIIKILDRDIDSLSNAIYTQRSKYTQYIRAGIFLKAFN